MRSLLESGSLRAMCARKHLWSHVEDIQRGIYIPPLKLMLYILRLCHVIHLVHGECSIQPLTPKDFSFAEELMKGFFKFPIAKEASLKKKGESKKKRKRQPDTSLVDQVTSGRLNPTGLVDPSPQKASSVKKPRSMRTRTW